MIVSRFDALVAIRPFLEKQFDDGCTPVMKETAHGPLPFKTHAKRID